MLILQEIQFINTSCIWDSRQVQELGWDLPYDWKLQHLDFVPKQNNSKESKTIESIKSLTSKNFQ